MFDNYYGDTNQQTMSVENIYLSANGLSKYIIYVIHIGRWYKYKIRTNHTLCHLI